MRKTLQQPIAFRPFMQKFIILAPIARRTGNNEVTGIVRPASRQGYNMINMIGTGPFCQLYMTVIAAIVLSFKLSSDVMGCKIPGCVFLTGMASLKPGSGYFSAMFTLSVFAPLFAMGFIISSVKFEIVLMVLGSVLPFCLEVIACLCFFAYLLFVCFIVSFAIGKYLLFTRLVISPVSFMHMLLVCSSIDSLSLSHLLSMPLIALLISCGYIFSVFLPICFAVRMPLLSVVLVGLSLLRSQFISMSMIVDSLLFNSLLTMLLIVSFMFLNMGIVVDFCLDLHACLARGTKAIFLNFCPREKLGSCREKLLAFGALLLRGVFGYDITHVSTSNTCAKRFGGVPSTAKAQQKYSSDYTTNPLPKQLYATFANPKGVS